MKWLIVAGVLLSLNACQQENLSQRDKSSHSESRAVSEEEAFDLGNPNDALLTWLAHFGKPVFGGPAQGDFNRDGFVDGDDFLIWQAADQKSAQRFLKENCMSVGDAFLKWQTGDLDLNGDGKTSTEDLLQWLRSVHKGKVCELAKKQVKTQDRGGQLPLTVEDYKVWLANFGKTVDGGIEDGDFDGDGEVDGDDFLIWQRSFKKEADEKLDRICMSMGDAFLAWQAKNFDVNDDGDTNGDDFLVYQAVIGKAGSICLRR